jgi:ribosomal protein L40E
MTNMTICSTCGKDTEPGATFCSKCGVSLTNPGCRVCGAIQPEKSQFCNKCGASQSQENSTPRQSTDISLAGYSQYYQQEFNQIRSSGEAYKGKWNWAAFFFGALWALTKGLWLPALICIIGSIFTAGIVGIVYWFAFGLRGNYMYYSKQIKHRNLPI